MIDLDDAERRVEEMIAEGRSVLRAAIDRYRPIAVVAAFSGGDDSVVAAHHAISEVADCFAFNADTLVGLGPARDHVRSSAARLGWHLEIGRAIPEGPPETMKVGKRKVPFDPAILPAGRWTDGDRAYEEFVLNFGFPGRGRRMHARMYQRLKERPIRRLVRSLGGKSGSPVLLVSGIRHDESAIRAGYKQAHSFGNDKSTAWVNPFYHRTAGDFALYRDEFGLPSNPVKRRCGISGECACGTFASLAIDERAAYREIDPRFDSYLSGLEARAGATGHPWGWGESPPAWWKDVRNGQGFLFDVDEDQCKFQPMCVGCHSARR